MLMIKVWFGVVVLCLVYSCHDKHKASVFSMNMDVVIKKSDSIHIFYKDDGTINFNEAESFWVKVKGQDRNQKIAIDFPKETIPNQIRIDFSKNLKQREIIFNKFEFTFKGNSFVAKGKEIYKYFRIDNSNTVLNTEFGSLIRKDTTKTLGPSLYPNGYYLAVKLEELKFKK